MTCGVERTEEGEGDGGQDRGIKGRFWLPEALMAIYFSTGLRMGEKVDHHPDQCFTPTGLQRLRKRKMVRMPVKQRQKDDFHTAAAPS